MSLTISLRSLTINAQAAPASPATTVSLHADANAPNEPDNNYGQYSPYYDRHDYYGYGPPRQSSPSYEDDQDNQQLPWYYGDYIEEFTPPTAGGNTPFCCPPPVDLEEPATIPLRNAWKSLNDYRHPPTLFLAVAMGLHPRLGADSPLNGLDSGTLAHICYHHVLPQFGQDFSWDDEPPFY